MERWLWLCEHKYCIHERESEEWLGFGSKEYMTLKFMEKKQLFRTSCWANPMFRVSVTFYSSFCFSSLREGHNLLPIICNYYLFKYLSHSFKSGTAKLCVLKSILYSLKLLFCICKSYYWVVRCCCGLFCLICNLSIYSISNNNFTRRK